MNIHRLASTSWNAATTDSSTPDSPATKPHITSDRDVMEVSSEQGANLPQEVEFRSTDISGKALGMHAWGAERSIDPESARVSFDGGTSYGPANFQVSVGGPVNEWRFKGRKGYSARTYFYGFDKNSLPPFAPLKEGLSLTASSGATLHYAAGKLTLETKQEIYSGFSEKVARIDRSQVEMTLSPYLQNIPSLRFVETHQKNHWLWGFGEPEIKTDVTISNLVKQ